MNGRNGRNGRSSRNRRNTPKLSTRPVGGRGWALALLKWGAILGLAGAALGTATMALLFWIYGSDPDLPRIAKLSDYDPLEVSLVESRDGEVIGEVYQERRSFVPMSEIPDIVVHAFISAEDANFFEHEGIDYLGMFRAALVNLKAGEKRQGASTITQQVVKTFLLSPERTFKRKFQEIVLARRLENALSKDEILGLYLNQIYFGHGRYGVEQASRFYFGKSVRDLNAGEAAMLAGLPQAPENISPKKKKNWERAKFRQKYVLEQMLHHGYISEEVAQHYIDAPIEVIGDPYPGLGNAPDWIGLAKQKLIDELGSEKAAYRAGVPVKLTVDLRVQEAAAEALRQDLRDLDEREGYGHPIRHIKKDKIDLEAAKLSRRLPKGGPKKGQLYRAVVRQVFDDDAGGEMVVDLGKWKASVLFEPVDPEHHDRYNDDGKKPSERFQPGDIVRVVWSGKEPGKSQRKPAHASRQVHLAAGPEGAVVVIDPHTREVLAMVGGYDQRAGDFNRAVQGKRQPGSTFKPLVYAAAIDSGEFTPASIVNDAPEVYDMVNGQWKPQNYEKGEFQGPVRLRYALAKSINTVAIRVIHDIGPERVVELAHALGIHSDLPQELSLALGSGEVSPLELANAFATLAAGGVYQPPVFVRSIGDRQFENPEPKRVLRPEVAYVVIDMMKSVITEGTGRRAARLGITLSGKTGTSNDQRDGWFIGITPDLVTAVWVGFDTPRNLGRREEGSHSALPAFIQLVKTLKLRDHHFERPAGVVDKRIDLKTGLLAAPTAPADSTYTEVFVAGTEPTDVAPLPDQVSADQFVVDQYDQYEGADTDGGDPAAQDQASP